MNARRPLDNRIKRYITVLTPLVMTDPRLFQIIPSIQIMIMALDIASLAPTQIATSRIAWRGVRRQRVLSYYDSPDHATKSEVCRDDSKVQFRVGPDGGDGVVVGQIGGLDAE